MNLGSYWFSDKIVLRMYRAQEVGPEHPLYQITERLARRASLPMPKVYIIPDPSPNAFATGRNPEHAAVAATEGILQVLERARARRRDRARARARQAPRHPDQLGRGDDCRGDHDVRADGDVCRLFGGRPRRSRRRQLEPDRAARDDDPGAAGGDADPDGDLALARVRRGCRRAPQIAGNPYGLADALRKIDAVVEARAARRESGDGAHVHHQAVHAAAA